MQKNIFKIFLHGLGIYLKKFFPLSRAMLFPVFGQIIGIALILTPVYFYRVKYLNTLSLEDLQRNLLFILFGIIIMVIPGFTVFFKAFWDYMVVMVSLNTMVADFINNKPPKSFKIHNGAINLRTKTYVILLFILMGIWLVFLISPFVLLLLSAVLLNKILSTIIFILSFITCLALLGIVSVYLSLSFQVFAFEACSARQIIIKSYEMIEGNFWRAAVLGLLLFILTGIIVPTVFSDLVKNSPVIDYLSIPFESYMGIILQNTGLVSEISKYGYTVSSISTEIALMSVGSVVTAFLLPLGSACFTLLYLDIKK